MGKNRNNDTLFSWATKTLWTVTVTMKLKALTPWNLNYDKSR